MQRLTPLATRFATSNVQRTTDGDWRLRIAKGSASDATLKALLDALVGWFKRC